MRKMEIKVNGKTCELPDKSNISTAIRELGINPAGIAIAVNGKVVPKTEYETHILCDSDEMVIIKAFYGG